MSPIIIEDAQGNSSTNSASASNSPRIRMTFHQMELLDDYIRDYYDSETKQIIPPHGTSHENFWRNFVAKLNKGAKNQLTVEKWQEHIKKRISIRTSSPKQTKAGKRCNSGDMDEPERKKKRYEHQENLGVKLIVPKTETRMFTNQLEMNFNTAVIQNSVVKHMESVQRKKLNNNIRDVRETNSTSAEMQGTIQIIQEEKKFRESLRILREKNKLAYQELREKQENLMKVLKLKKKLLLLLTKAGGV